MPGSRSGAHADAGRGSPAPSARRVALQFSAEAHSLDPQSGDALRAYRANLDGRAELTGHFTGLLTCMDESCDGKTVMAGDFALSYSDEPDIDWSTGNPSPEFTEYFRVRFLAPAPTLIEVPESTPIEIAAAIDEASRCFWISPASAANLFRQAVERVLDKEGVASSSPSGGHVSTHKRIKQYGKAKPVQSALLEATKWIGNSGSHDLDLTAKEVLAGAEYLARVLGDLWAAPALLARARAVNTAKGPVR